MRLILGLHFLLLKQDMETECLKPNSTILNDIGLGLLKLVSSHRGLTYGFFRTRRLDFAN